MWHRGRRRVKWLPPSAVPTKVRWDVAGMIPVSMRIGSSPVAERLLSIREYGGLPLGTNQVVEGVLGLLQGAEVPA